MATADHGGPGPDYYQLLGVARGASREEIARAWRRRARGEHPDRRPGQAGDEAAGRFRALAEAWRVLSDPARRAAYDHALGRGRAAAGSPPAVPVPVRVNGPGPVPGPGGVPGPALRAGPVRVEGWYEPPGSGPDEDDPARCLILCRQSPPSRRQAARNPAFHYTSYYSARRAKGPLPTGKGP
jgi:curved DNA-binding protein CbpA